jgi:hypothetical protein
MIQGLKIIKYDEGRFGLTIMEPGGTDAAYWDIFEEHDLDGGGYTWQGLVASLVQLQLPEASSKIKIGAEADNAYVDSMDKEVLESIAALIESCISDPQLLGQAIENADGLE